ncbi:S-adenosylmethionine synthase [Frankliniella fusca]|uniref:S-adenosylmethionine synthase n=1 Tax=Frankliniella fusca TaxID=407009 RepID=A0AAE1HNS1_9NEOP|nr:S-adenosylmethionine synthase [Frankliniella fusca]
MKRVPSATAAAASSSSSGADQRSARGTGAARACRWRRYQPAATPAAYGEARASADTYTCMWIGVAAMWPTLVHQRCWQRCASSSTRVPHSGPEPSAGSPSARKAMAAAYAGFRTPGGPGVARVAGAWAWAAWGGGMERWVPISLAVFLGLAAVIVVVFTAIYSNDVKAERPRGPRLRVFLVPPPARPSRPSNWTAPPSVPPLVPPPAGNASLLSLSLSNLAGVFPVDSSFPELFLLRPEDRLLGRQDAAAAAPDAVMDVPGGHAGASRPRPAGGESVGPGPGIHKIVRGDRRMTFGDEEAPVYTIPRPAATVASPPGSAVRLASPTSPPPARPRMSSPSRPSPPRMTRGPAGTGKSAAPAAPAAPAPAETSLDVDLCVSEGGAPLFVREEDTRALLEDTLRQVKPAESAVMRKAMKALMEAYERHMQMEEAPSTRPTSGCLLPRTSRTTPRPPAPSRTPRPRRPWWDLDDILDRRLPVPTPPGAGSWPRRPSIDYPADYDNDYNHLDDGLGPRRVAWPLRPSFRRMKLKSPISKVFTKSRFCWPRFKLLVEAKLKLKFDFKSSQNEPGYEGSIVLGLRGHVVKAVKDTYCHIKCPIAVIC